MNPEYCPLTDHDWIQLLLQHLKKYGQCTIKASIPLRICRLAKAEGLVTGEIRRTKKILKITELGVSRCEP